MVELGGLMFELSGLVVLSWVVYWWSRDSVVVVHGFRSSGSELSGLSGIVAESLVVFWFRALVPCKSLKVFF